MIVMDRENLFARGWSHVVSSTGDVAELEAFRVRVGAPPAALQLGNPRWPHLDLRGPPRDTALELADVVVERSADLVRYIRALRAVTSRA
jgi:hypothetical protein